MNSPRQEIVIIFSHLPWDFPCDYLKQTSFELAKRARAIIFSPLVLPTLKNLLFDKEKREKWLALFKEKEINYFPSLAIFPFQRFKFVEKLNIWLNFFLFRLFYLLRFGFRRPIFWVFSHQLVVLKNWFCWSRVLVYDRVDQVASLDPKIDKAIKKEDRELLSMADYVFTNSPYALKYIKGYNNKSFLVPCGCNVSLFLEKKGIRPREMKKIKRPILGLIGSLDHRLDFPLLYSLIKKKKEWNFVFIGSPFSQDVAQFRIVNIEEWFTKLKKFSNVYFLGQKPKEKLADFIASFDVCLIPYDVSQEFVRGSNPMKLYEYLAMGKPVVSTPIEAVRVYSPTVKIAEDAFSFEKAIEAFLKMGYNKKEEEKRKGIALENSWKKKVEAMWRVVTA